MCDLYVILSCINSISCVLVGIVEMMFCCFLPSSNALQLRLFTFATVLLFNTSKGFGFLYLPKKFNFWIRPKCSTVHRTQMHSVCRQHEIFRCMFKSGVTTLFATVGHFVTYQEASGPHNFLVIGL